VAQKIVKHVPVGEGLDSVEWVGEELHALPTDTILITSKPPSGMCKVVELFVNPQTGKFVVRYDNTPVV